MNFKEKACIGHVRQHLARMNEHMDNFCKRRAPHKSLETKYFTVNLLNKWDGKTNHKVSINSQSYGTRYTCSYVADSHQFLSV